MSSSNNGYNNGSNNGVYPLSLYLPSLSGQQDIIRNPYNHQLTASPGQMLSAVPESLMDYMEFNSNNVMNQQSFEIPEVSREIKKAVKKDRHSKIHTAQGLRDRRVRLSIGISRQFFDLQDMLGFDKASKTLDWLLKKSRRAIKELVQEKKLNNNVEDFGNDGGNVVHEEDDYDDDNVGDNSFVYGSSPYSFEEEVLCEVKKAEKRKKKTEMSNISSKGSRAKAKGKAKGITIDMTNDHPETASEIIQTEIMDPFKRSIIFNEGEEMTHSFYKESIQESDNHECITKTEVNLPMNMDQGYNQHYGALMLKDQGSSSNYNAILPQNFDCDYNPNPFIDQLFCGVTNTNFFRGFP